MTNTNNTTSALVERHIPSIKSFIDEQLRIRGINVETKLELLERKNRKTTLDLISTKFNTFPVLHSEIVIADFGSGFVEETKEYYEKNKETGEIETREVERIRVWISVHASYEGNGVGLFDVEAIILLKHPETVHLETVAKSQESTWDN